MALADFDLIHDFGDAAAEARACRTNCALFDFSFLECARLEGDGAQNLIETFTGRSLNNLRQKAILYALRAGPGGALAADLTVWKTGNQSFEVMSGRREDIASLLLCSASNVNVSDVTMQRAVFAVQGPNTLAALRRIGDMRRVQELSYFTFDKAELAGIPCTIGRLGYTGEAGVEIITERDRARELWGVLSKNVTPAGFVAADTLRIEAGLVLFRNEFRVPVGAREAGLEKFGKNVDQPGPVITLVSFRAKAGRLECPWQPSTRLNRPTEPGTVVVTSACESEIAGGVLGLGYVVAGTSPHATVHEASGAFRDVHLTRRPYYDPDRRRARSAWS
ncbi:MAG TPA: hypothetical protein VFI98_01505 [Pseudolabrys sp.]|nr:hypothetical protein [Pseudolabrys sp.]